MYVGLYRQREPQGTLKHAHESLGIALRNRRAGEHTLAWAGNALRAPENFTLTSPAFDQGEPMQKQEFQVLPHHSEFDLLRVCRTTVTSRVRAAGSDPGWDFLTRSGG